MYLILLCLVIPSSCDVEYRYHCLESCALCPLIDLLELFSFIHDIYFYIISIHA